jgi:4-hydroxy-3-methylbut-2-enyl diphosphate reductase
MKQFAVPHTYRSDFITGIKNKRRGDDKLKKDFSPTLLDFGPIKIYLARHFGFCYGVENAIEIAFTTLEENPGKRIFLLSEMIHNPQVNEDLQDKGIRFLQDTQGNQVISFDDLAKDDIVLIPAFGTTLEIEDILRSKNIQTEKYNTTCPFVEKVWNRSEQIAQKGYSIVVHGKPRHEETRATFSHASTYTPTVVINNMKEAIELGKYITGEKQPASFYDEFKQRFSDGFNITKDLQRFGVVNQTTQLATDTQAIAEYLKQVVKTQYNLTDNNIQERFADTRDTLCYATHDNQSAAIALLSVKADLAIVVGGYNSSNTSHLVELCEEKLPTYFINDPDKIISSKEIFHCNWKTKTEYLTENFLPIKRPVIILLTSGASCPDSLVEQVIEKLRGFFTTAKTIEELHEEFFTKK